MNQKEKDLFLEEASQTLTSTIEKIKDRVKKYIIDNKKIREELPKENEDNKIVQQRLLEDGVRRKAEMEAMTPSPYFVRCLVDFENGTQDEMYFGKFAFSDENIYSWITPASSIRFEKPGHVSYERPDGERREGVLRQKIST